MAQQIIDTTTPQPNGKIGDTAKVAFGKVNDNFTELFGSLDALDTRVTANEGAINALDTRVTSNEGAISALAAVVQALPGMIAYFAMETPPAGWLRANGALVSRTTYANLFAAIGTRFGAGDGSTTFRLPDLRGEFLRGWDDGRGVDPGRVLGSTQKGTLVGGYDDNTVGENMSFLLGKAIFDYGGDPVFAGDYADGIGRYSTEAFFSPAPINSAFFAVTRPRNVAMLACIKF